MKEYVFHLPFYHNHIFDDLVLLDLALTHHHSIARSTGTLLLQRNSVIRNLTNWGVFDLPKPTVKHQTQHHKGHYFVMQFDCSASTQQEVRRQLGLNPHMIRFSVVKLGDKLGGYRNQKGKIEDVVGDGRKEWGGLREDVEALEAFKSNMY